MTTTLTYRDASVVIDGDPSLVEKLRLAVVATEPGFVSADVTLSTGRPMDRKKTRTLYGCLTDVLVATGTASVTVPISEVADYFARRAKARSVRQTLHDMAQDRGIRITCSLSEDATKLRVSRRA